MPWRGEVSVTESDHAAIDAQLDVLEKRMSEDDIWSEWQDPEDPEEMPNTLDAALQARRWLDGDNADGAPSKGWKELAK